MILIFLLTKYHDESSAYKVVLLDNNGNPLVNEQRIKFNLENYLIQHMVRILFKHLQHLNHIHLLLSYKI